MKAYGIPVQSYTWRPANSPSALFAKAAEAQQQHHSQQLMAAANNSNSSGCKTTTVVVTTSPSPCSSSSPGGTTASTISERPISPDLEACHLSTKQLEDLMDDECQGPVSNGDPMLSSPHLSPHGVMSSPASSSHYSTTNDDALSPADSMDLAA